MTDIDLTENQILRHGQDGLIIVWRDGCGEYTYTGAKTLYDTLEDALAAIPDGMTVIYDAGTE